MRVPKSRPGVVVKRATRKTAGRHSVLGFRLNRTDTKKERYKTREKELEEAQATLNQVLTEDLAEFQKELAIAEKEAEQVQARLNLLLAGFREEEIEATEAEIARLDTQRRLLEEQLGATILVCSGNSCQPEQLFV